MNPYTNCQYCGVAFKGNGGPCVLGPAPRQVYLCHTCYDAGTRPPAEAAYDDVLRSIRAAHEQRQHRTVEQLLAVLSETQLVGLPQHTMGCLLVPQHTMGCLVAPRRPRIDRLRIEWPDGDGGSTACCHFARAWQHCRGIETELHARGVSIGVNDEG